MRKFLLLFLILLVSCSNFPKKSKTKPKAQAKIVFEVSDGILHPESVYYSPKHKIIFVSNIANGNPLDPKKESFLSQVSPDGKMIKLKWIEGFRAPKGLTVFGDFLYVSDVDRVVKIDISKSKIVKTFPVPYAKFLNDVTHDAEGNIYISDMKDDVIYKISQNKLSEWIKDTKVYSANGLFTDGKEHMIVAKWGIDLNPETFEAKIPGSVAIVSIKDPKKIELMENLRGHLDGIDVDHKGDLWISDWMNGNIYQMKKNGSFEHLYNFGQGAADISVAKDLKLLLIPQMFQNKIIAVEIP